MLRKGQRCKLKKQIRESKDNFTHIDQLIHGESVNVTQWEIIGFNK